MSKGTLVVIEFDYFQEYKTGDLKTIPLFCILKYCKEMLLPHKTCLYTVVLSCIAYIFKRGVEASIKPIS